GKYEDRAGRIRGDGVPIERIANSDGENARHNGVDAVFGMPMRHQLCTKRRLHTNHIWPRFRRMAHDNGQLYAGRERCKRLPVDLLRQDRHESVFAGLMWSAHDDDSSLGDMLPMSEAREGPQPGVVLAWKSSRRIGSDRKRRPVAW